MPFLTVTSSGSKSQLGSGLPFLALSNKSLNLVTNGGSETFLQKSAPTPACPGGRSVVLLKMEVSLELSFGILGDGKKRAGKDAGATQKRPGWSRGALLYGSNVADW